jgi:hypothetical protein
MSTERTGRNEVTGILHLVGVWVNAYMNEKCGISEMVRLLKVVILAMDAMGGNGVICGREKGWDKLVAATICVLNARWLLGCR